MRVADYVAEHLENIGVKHVFLLSGGGMMHLLDAVSRRKNLTYICNHHEQASGIAADAHARITGSLGVCYATSGPGGTNTLTAVVGAFQDSSPVLFISGQSKVSQTIEGSKIEGLRQFGTFEVDIIQNVKSVTKYAGFVSKAQDIRYHLEKAIFMAMDGRPGSVFLDIPIDIQGAPVDPASLRGFNPSELDQTPKHTKYKAINNQTMDTVVTALGKAKKPLILAGYGVRVAGAEKTFLDLVNKLNIPVVSTCFGKDIIPYDHPLFVGHPGMKGDRAGNLAIQSADLIISVGCSLHVTTTGYELDQFAPKAHKIMVDPDPAVLQREEVGFQDKILGEVKTFLNALSEKVGGTKIVSNEAWLSHCKRIKNELSVYKEPHKVEGDQINIYNFMEVLDTHCQENDIIVTDAGSAFYVVGQAFRVKKGQRVINSGSLGAMGFALPAATGAALAASGGRVICVTGDGSLQTNIHELAVFKRYNLNIKLFVVNNDGYVCIRNSQTNFFSGHFVGTSYESGVFIPKTDKIANAYELPYSSTDKFSKLDSLVKNVLNSNGPAVCEVFTPPYQDIIPTVSSVRLENGSMKSKPIHEMAPFMSDEMVKKYEF